MHKDKRLNQVQVIQVALFILWMKGVDTGPILVQETVKIKNDDTEETLSKKILAKEHKAYPEAVRLIAEKKISVVGRKVKILS